MMKRKLRKCDHKGCEEIAEWYREYKGELLKLCTKHEAYFARGHWGKSLDPSELDEDDLRYLEEKDEKDYYQCPHCDHILYKEDAIISGYNSHSSLKHIHCSKCGKVITYIA